MRKLFTFAALCAVVVGQASASVVYDNINRPDPNEQWEVYMPTPGKIGDVLNLAGTDRLLSSVDLEVFTATGYTGSVDFSVYAWDSGSNQPGALLEQQTVTGFTAAQSNFATVSVAAAPVTLPDTVLVAFQFDDFVAGTNELGSLIGWNPTVGTSSDFMWDFASGTEISFGGGANSATTANMSIRVNANPVPEPVSMLVLGAGLLSAAARRRR